MTCKAFLSGARARKLRKLLFNPIPVAVDGGGIYLFAERVRVATQLIGLEDIGIGWNMCVWGMLRVCHLYVVRICCGRHRQSNRIYCSLFILHSLFTYSHDSLIAITDTCAPVRAKSATSPLTISSISKVSLIPIDPK